jgi:phenylacetate-CoA ligase
MAPTPPEPDWRAQQAARLRALLDAVPRFPLYREKFAGIPLRDIRTPADLTHLPFTTKAELVADQAAHPPYGRHHSEPSQPYTRLHQTSGTSTGKPLRWLDTPASWKWLLDTWAIHFRLMGITAVDRILFPFSFGPFLGFWSGFESASRMGALTLPCGGMSTAGRLRMILEHGVTVVCCTPTYAMHLAGTAEAEGIDLRSSPVRALVVAGEPGGGLPAVRKQLSERWGARVFDHYGLTETGPVANEADGSPGGLFAIESEFVVEVLEPGGDRKVAVGETGELVVTNLGRIDSPLIRYRTGDIVRKGEAKAPPPGHLPEAERGNQSNPPRIGEGGSPGEPGGVPPWAFFPGGILGRVDDMIHIRGNNVYPSAIEDVLRRFPAIAEYRIVLDTRGPLADLRIEVETPNGAAPLDAVERAIRDALMFRADVVAVSTGTLPRSEMKSRRVCVRSS